MLDTLDHLASIATALIAAFAYGRYRWIQRQKRLRVEEYLRSQIGGDRYDGKGHRTVMHITAALGMTEADILEAAFNSKKIRRWAARDRETGRAAALYLEYFSN